MAEQYLRECLVDVAGVQVRGGGNDDLRIRFEIAQNDRSTPNYAHVILTNVSPETRGKIMGAAPRAPCSVRAGYESGSGLLFKGQIQQARSGRDENAITDTYIHVLATDQEVARNYGVVSETLSAGHTYKDRVDLAFKAFKPFGVELGYIVDLPKRKFTRPFSFFGMAADLLRDVCRATSSTWSIQNGKFEMVGVGQPAGSTGPLVLNSETGLIGRPVQTMNGIEGRCLLNPRIRPNSLVQIDEKSIERLAQSPSYTAEGRIDTVPNIAADGVYNVFVVGHRGDSRGGEWYSEFIGIKKGDPISSALAGRGYGELPSVQRGVPTGVPGDDAPATGNAKAFTDPSIKAGPR